MTPLRIAVWGKTGRMGRTVLAAIDDFDGFEVATDATDAAAVAAGADVVIDFSTPEGLATIAEACAAAGCPLVSGTTGLDDEARAALDAAARAVPVVYAPNMSIGINIILQAIELASQTIPDSWRCDIHEVHHAGKRDAPSGTALRLGAAIERHRGEGTVDFASERTGDVVGDHRVRFTGPGETLEFAHHAADRAIFAHGALHAARWVHGRPPGLYGMAEVLALK